MVLYSFVVLLEQKHDIVSQIIATAMVLFYFKQE